MPRDGIRAGRGRDRSALRPTIEPLEGRRLLSGMPVTKVTVSSGHATYRVKVSGPGEVAVHPAGKGQFNIDLLRSTSATSLAIQQVGVNAHYDGSLLPVARINASSGSIGQVLGAGTVNLLGTIRTSGPVGSIQLGAVGRSARIIANGGLGSLSVSGLIGLGPQGRISVAGDLPGTLQAGAIDLAGGTIAIGHDLGALSAGSLVVGNGGQFLVGHDAGPIAVAQNTSMTGGSFTVADDAHDLRFGHDLAIAAGGRLAVGRALIGSLTVNGGVSIDVGQISIGRDLVGSASINGDLSAVNGGNLTVGRDLTGSLAVGGDLSLRGGGAIAIGRNVGAQAGGGSGLVVGGNLSTAAGGMIRVGGDLDGLQAGGTIVGQGTDAVDLTVGLDFNNWSVAGGAVNLGGVTNFNVDVGKNIGGVDVRHGLFNDFITAGVLITNVNVGADGPVAVFDTEIRAGVQITNVVLGGDVKSDRPTNPTGRRTRIIAGEDRLGNFEYGGNLDNFVITGSLIDAVVVASVQPTGGNGTVSRTPAPPPAPGTPDDYDAPAGGVFLGVANAGQPYAAPPYSPRIDPTIDDNVLPGSINPSFAPTAASAPFPIRSTVLGGVITTAHANNSDYAGLFAADTRDVFVGPLR